MIRSLLVEIGKQKLALEAVLRKKRRLKRDREKILTEVRIKKRKEQRELTKIRQSKKELKTYLTEKQAGVKQLEAILKKIRDDIARVEREERIRQQQMALNAKEFPKLKRPIGVARRRSCGNQIWPSVESKVENNHRKPRY